MAGKVFNPETGKYEDIDSRWSRPIATPPQRSSNDWQKRRRRAAILLSLYLAGGFILLVALIAVVTGLPYEKLTIREFDATVVSQILCGPEKTRYCIVVAHTDGREEVLENTDSLWNWKWNSADFQARLMPGKRFHFMVYGWRFGILTMFRNIIGAEPLGNS